MKRGEGKSYWVFDSGSKEFGGFSLKLLDGCEFGWLFYFYVLLNFYASYL